MTSTLVAIRQFVQGMQFSRMTPPHVILCCAGPNGVRLTHKPQCLISLDC